MNKFHTDLFYNSCDGKNLKFHSELQFVHSWLRDGMHAGRHMLTGRDSIAVLQLRAGLLPTPERKARISGLSPFCECCRNAVASYHHILQECPVATEHALTAITSSITLSLTIFSNITMRSPTSLGCPIDQPSSSQTWWWLRIVGSVLLSTPLSATRTDIWMRSTRTRLISTNTVLTL